MARDAYDPLIGFLREIISIPSFTGREGACVPRIRREMLSLGYDEVKMDAMGNLLGRIGHGPRVIALDGHVDTVGVSDASAWQHDPFDATIENGWLYGRGSADQKAGLAAAVYAGARVKAAGLGDRLTLWVVASVHEEDDEGVAWQHLIEAEGLEPDAVILTEPSDGMVKLGHRGRLEMEVVVSGLSCHGSAPERGVNPITASSELALAIHRLNNRLHSDSPLGEGSIAVTEIKTTAPSLCAIPDQVVLHLDRRMTEGESAATCMAEIHSLPEFDAEAMALVIPEHGIETHIGCRKSMKAEYPAWRLPETHRLVRIAELAHDRVFEKSAKLGFWTFATHGVATAGLYDIPTIGFGPGTEAMAHAVDERVSVEEVVKAVALYSELIVLWAEDLCVIQ